MVTAKTVKGLAERLAKAEQLVADGAVFPVAGCAGYAVVKNGDGTEMYLVRVDAGQENCTCPDFKERQSAAGLPCKHLLAAELALGEISQPPAVVEPTGPRLGAGAWAPPEDDPVKASAATGANLLLAPSRRKAA